MTPASRAVPEDQVRSLLHQYGIPTPKFALLHQEADIELAGLTYPVALKVCSAEIFHKTDVGGVHLNIPNASALRTVLGEMKINFLGAAFLCEPMEPPGTEVIVGLVNDSTFGPCILAGLGGVFAEVLEDVSFRVVPIDRDAADSMLRDLKGHRVLEGFRGKKVDREALLDLLVNVSRLAVERHDEIDQLDLNPVILHERGLCVVDAKLILSGERPTPVRTELHSPDALRPILYPESVAVIGASPNQAKFGGMVMRNLMEGKYAGVIYPINPHAAVIQGLRVYRRIQDVPGPVDLAVLVVPAEHISQAVRECEQQGVKSLAICAGGFDDLSPEGALKGKELRAILGHGAARAVGPNQMGVVNMNNGCWAAFGIEALTSRFKRGCLGIVVQSGSVGSAFLELGCYDGVGFSLYMSLGNRMDTDEADWIQFMDSDSSVKVICVELEGIKNGERFVRAIKAARKPIVALKTGRTSIGYKAAASHSEALATNERIVTGAFKQHGVHHCETIEEMYDAAKMLAFYGPINGRRLLAIETSGGLGIIACDEAERAGLEMPEVSEERKALLREVLSPQAIVRNWIDIVSPPAEAFVDAAKTGVADDYDIVLMIFGDPVERAGEIVSGCRTHIKEPIVVVFSGGGEVRDREWPLIQAQGVPVFANVERALTYFRLRPRAWV